MGVRSDSLTFKFIYAKSRPAFLKLILVVYMWRNFIFFLSDQYQNYCSLTHYPIEIAF